MRKVLLCLAVMLVSACMPEARMVNVLKPQRIYGAKEITYYAQSKPWAVEIEKKLIEKGFKVYRYSFTSAREDDLDMVVDYGKSKTRLLLIVKAKYDESVRCWGGGFLFDYINVELVDVQNKETVAYYSNNKYSENCEPYSRPVFEEIARMADGYWTGNHLQE